jgi:hypothetical protein
LRELDGNFIAISKGNGEKGTLRFVQFHNPSIKDCIETYLRKNLRDARELCRTAQFFEQLRGLWNSVWKAPGASVPKVFWKALQRTFDARSCTYIHSDNWTFLSEAKLDSRASFIIEIAKQKPSDEAIACAKFAVERLTNHTDRATLDSGTVYVIALQLAAAIYETKQIRDAGLETCKEILLVKAERAGVLSRQFDDAARFVEHFPGALCENELDVMRDRFRKSLHDDVEGIASNIEDHDAYDIQKALEGARRASTILSVSVDDEVERLERAHAARVEYDEKQSEKVESWPTPASASEVKEDTTDEEIQGMFGTLLDSE